MEQGKRTTPGHYVPNGRIVTLWHCEECGFRGTTGTWKAPCGSEGLWCYKCANKGLTSPLRSVREEDTTWQPGLTEVMCCGTWLRCDRFTNTCHRCHTDYNANGVRLAPRECWGEETGETAADIVNGSW